MKKQNFLCLLTAAVIVMLVTACGSTPAAGTGPGSGSPPPTQSSQVEFIRTDYQGAAIGSNIPDWVEAAINGDLETIKRIPRFNGKVPIVDWGNGQNLDLLRSWVNNFNVSAGISRRISTYVEAEFGGTQLGTKDTQENRNFLREVVATLSSAEFSGLAREMDYWVKLRIVDHAKGTQTEEYRYFVVFSIPEDVLQYQIDVAMGKISAQTQEQQEIKNDVEEAMKRARFNSIQQSN